MSSKKEDFARVHVRYRDDAEQDIELPSSFPAEHALGFACALFHLTDQWGRQIITESQFLTMNGQQVRAFHVEPKERA